jgi:hypothetical protein
MTQEELIREVGKVIPNGVYSEEVIQLAFTMFTHGYNYAVDKACKWIDDNVLEFKGESFVHDFKDCLQDFRIAMEE